MAEEQGKGSSSFAIFKAREATDYKEDGLMYAGPSTPVEQEGMAALTEAGLLDGSHLKLLFSRPGMSLTYVWFKSGYALPLHSHSADCLYFIVGGSLTVGNEALGPGDGFFLGADVPYAYVPGEQGVEVLEFRASDHFDFKTHAKSKAYWQTAVAKMAAARVGWLDETRPPSGILVG